MRILFPLLFFGLMRPVFCALVALKVYEEISQGVDGVVAGNSA